jgi:hypothetical protein
MAFAAAVFRKHRFSTTAATVAVLATALALAAPGQATFPGANGKIPYLRPTPLIADPQIFQGKARGAGGGAGVGIRGFIRVPPAAHPRRGQARESVA